MLNQHLQILPKEELIFEKSDRIQISIKKPINQQGCQFIGSFQYRWPGRSGKVLVEDFSQVAGMSRETKYNYSMEKVVSLIETYCTFPMVEKVKLFRRVLFCWLTGNEDMHLKNFSLIHQNGKIELSPAYDLLNTTIILANPVEEIALPLKGKKSNFTRNIFFNYFGQERMGLNEKVLGNIEEGIKGAYPEWERLTEICFLSDGKKEEYLGLIKQRMELIGF